jgi:glycosyltransferase involved in cell wall biosynthesis
MGLGKAPNVEPMSVVGARKFTRQESSEITKGLTTPPAKNPSPAQPGKLRIALLVYRGNPTCGGQGVYTRHLSRELVRLGHSVTVFSGPPWPIIDEGVGFVPVPSLDLYRSPDPFRWPKLGEIKSWPDVVELVSSHLGHFAEPRVFAWRVERLLKNRQSDFDLIHDNQTIGFGIERLKKGGWTILESVHHPITVDREIAVSHARTKWARLGAKRWYSFLTMQIRVLRSLPAVVTVSHNSKFDIHSQMGVPLERLTVVPVGVDHDIFKPNAQIPKVPGRIIVTTSSDAPMKGLVPLLEAVAKIRTTRNVSLTVIGKPSPTGPIAEALARLSLTDVVQTVTGVSDEEMAARYAEAEVAVVPSLYEGFSLPAIEAMSCGVPLVATTGGALPEVVGESGVTGILVAPGNPDALAEAIVKLLDDSSLRERIGAAGRVRVLNRFTWEVTARGTEACYRALLDETALPLAMTFN